MTLHEWLKSASRSATSLMVGTLLIAINYGQAIIAGQITQERIFQMLLTVVVPYMVSTASSVATRHELRQVSPIRTTLRIDRPYGEPELVVVGDKCSGNTFGQMHWHGLLAGAIVAFPFTGSE